MQATSRLGRQITEIISTLARINAQSALIGGLALAPYKVVRATQDVDLLVDEGKADDIHAAIVSLGYTCLHRNSDVGNYQRNDERVDFLYASRPIARHLLVTATELNTSLGTLRVISPEGLIGFKIQGFANNPARTRDLEDIKSLLRANRATLKMDEVREYFRLFEKEVLLDELLR